MESLPDMARSAPNPEERPGSADTRRPPKARAAVWSLLVFASGGACGALLTHPDAEAASSLVDREHVSPTESAAEAAGRTHSEPSPSLGLAPDASIPVEDRGPEDVARALARGARRAAVQFDGFVGAVAVEPHAATEPEVVANAVGAYADGWADAVLSFGPEAVGAVATELSSRLCDEGTEPFRSLMLLRIALRIAPGTPSLREGVLCVVRESGGRPDIVLTTALDVWQAGAFGDAPELTELRSRADPALRSHLLTHADLVRERLETAE